MTTLYDFAPTALDGGPTPLSQFRDKVLLIVNTASQCGFTGQYAGLEDLHRRFGPKGFEVLGFPCNQFGAQEPGDAAEIAAFCSLTYAVDFPMFAKIEVNGPGADPLYAWLKKEKPGLLGTGGIKWNFTKFLIDRSGKVVDRFGPQVTPQQLEKPIERLLG